MDIKELFEASGIPSEKVEVILNEMKKNKIFISNEENMDIRYRKLSIDSDDLKSKLKESNELIEKLKNGDRTQELHDIIRNYESRQKELEEQIRQIGIDTAIKTALFEAKSNDLDYLMFKFKQKIDDLRLNEEGKIIGQDNVINALKIAYPEKFDDSSKKNIWEKRLPDVYPDFHGGMSRSVFDQMGYTARVKLHNENPELYNEMTGNKS